MRTRRYKIEFTTGEKFITSCYDDFHPENAVRDWQNPTLTVDKILRITELLTDAEVDNAKQEVFGN